MHIRPILSTLRRHKTAAALIVLEIALTCAIVSNAVFLIGSRIERMDMPTGLAEAELLQLRVSGITRVDNADALTQQDLQALRDLPGVKAAATVNQYPFSANSSTTALRLTPDRQTQGLVVSSYLLGEGALETMGLRLIAGRAFQPDEFRPQSAVERDPEVQMPSIMLDRAAAARLFPDRSAVGQTVYVFGNAPTRVVGVVERLVPARPQESGGGEGSSMMPVRPSYREGYYLLRVDPARRQEVLRSAATTLEALDSRRVVSAQSTFEDVRRDHFRQDRWMAGLLVAVCLALLVVTAFGIVGLASFWVQQRTRMIGVRRALGASRRQILRYFQTENFLLTGIGIVLGSAGAYAINHLLMLHYELPRLPWGYLPVGAITLWALGQLAVLGPALRAAALPPVVVMRGV